MLRRCALTYALLLVVLCPALMAQERLSPAALRQAGIEPERFQPIVWSHNERWLAGVDEAPFAEKKEGIFHRLWFLEVGTDGRVIRTQKVPLRLANFQQGEFTPGDDAFVVLGNRGTVFLRVDLKTFQVAPMLQPEVGQSGFRADPAVLWTEAGRLYTAGFPYDEARFIQTRTIATVNPQNRGAAAFQAGPDMASLEKTLERLWFTCYLSPTSAFYGQKYSDCVVLSHWNGQRVQEFDRPQRLWGSWSQSQRIVYSVERPGGLQELLVFDAGTGQKSLLASGQDVYRYLFLSRDGRTAVVSLMVPEGRRLSTFTARADDGWKLRPLEVDAQGRPRTIPAGWMRVSSKGSHLAHVSANGLAIYPLGR